LLPFTEDRKSRKLYPTIINDNIFFKPIPEIFWTIFVTPGTKYGGRSSFWEGLLTHQILQKYYNIKMLKGLEHFPDELSNLALIMRMTSTVKYWPWP
jgi:hypothetical protein